MALAVIIFAVLFHISKCWDLNYFGVGDNYYASNIGIYRNRAFLALPRSSCYNNVSNPTLMEVPWMGEYENVTVKRKIQLSAIKEQNWNNCKQLQDVVSVDIDRKKGRLWVLDKGNDLCSPKVVVYNLIFNWIILSRQLKGVSRKNLNSLVIDVVSSDFGPRAYIGDAGQNQLIVFSLNNGKWWKLKLREKSGVYKSIPSSYLAISKIKPIMFLTGNATELFVINLEEIRKSEMPQQENGMETPVECVGNKLGPSAGLLMDYKEGLNYFLIRDFAILRWNTRKPLKAEYHDVLAQSYTNLYYVSQLFLGPQNGIWALVNPMRPLECEARNKSNSYVPEVHLKTRVVKILKFNFFNNFY